MSGLLLSENVMISDLCYTDCVCWRKVHFVSYLIGTSFEIITKGYQKITAPHSETSLKCQLFFVKTRWALFFSVHWQFQASYLVYYIKAASTSSMSICCCLIQRLVLLWSWCSSKQSPPWAWLPIQGWLGTCSAGDPTDIWVIFSKSLEILVEKKICSSKDNLRTSVLP